MHKIHQEASFGNNMKLMGLPHSLAVRVVKLSLHQKKAPLYTLVA
jgi:hypothetical protein